ncbi:DUF262 domain-containing protein [bacterium]|nr:MAG: DUF262 domain-containing protein [bacterium]
MPDFVIIRLGKDSVPDIKRIDSFQGAPETPVSLTVTCTQVPLIVGLGYYAFLYLGSDNSKGIPTQWAQGLRALGKIAGKRGGAKYADACEIDVEVKVIFPESINKEDFLQKTSSVYYWFSGMPVIGLSSYSNQTVQQVKAADPAQDISALFYAIGIAQKDFKAQIEMHYPELKDLFNYRPPSEIDEKEIKSEGAERLDDGVKLPDVELPDAVVENIVEKSGWDEYPLDAVFVRTEQRTVSEVVKRIEAERFILNPDFQREFVWPLKKQSRLIESCLMRIPLPVFYVAEAKDGRIIVVDGLQRLLTFTRYLSNEFSLSSLGTGKEDSPQENPLLGKKFSDLPITLQERVEDTQLTLYILDAKAPERAKLDIFERVNSGEPLSRQQMRNCLFNGSATRWLWVAAKTTAFINATGGSLDRKSMRDREAINRFCAFRLLGVERYKGDMDVFLATNLEEMNSLSKSELDSLSQEFERSMKINHMLFGKHAFRKSLAEKTAYAPRTVINIALFDVCSVLFAPIEENVAANCADQLRDSISSLIKDETFIQAITYGTNGLRQVRTRFQMMKMAIEGVI